MTESRFSELRWIGVILRHSTMIYASRIANLTDARYFAAWPSVQYLGFNLEAGTDNYLDPVYMQAMREWVEGPAIVGEFSSGQTPAAVIREAATFYQLDAVLVPDTTDLTALSGIPLIVETSIVQPDLSDFLRKNRLKASFFILNIPAEWSDYTEQMQAICTEFPVLVKMNTDPAGYAAIQQAWRPEGFVLSGGAEEKVGVKSFDEIDAVLEMLDNEM